MCFKWAWLVAPMSTTQSSTRADQLYILNKLPCGPCLMWLTVSEDPHGRIRYHQDHFPRGTYRPPRRVPSPSSPETIYSSYPPPPLDRYSSSAVVDLEREEYDNVNPDSPIPQYYYGYSCSPGTSSSSTYDEDYNVPKREQYSSQNGGSRRNCEYGTRNYHDSNGYNTRKTIYWDPKEFSYTLGTSGRFSSRRSPVFNEPTDHHYGTYRSREHTIPILVESGPKKYRDSSPRELDSAEFDSRIHALKDHYRDPKELNFMSSKTEYRDPKEFSSRRSSKSIYGDPKEFLSNDLDFLKEYEEEDPIYRSAISEYQAFPKREPMVPSPDYSPPPPVNRVRFLDDEVAEKRRNGYSTYCQRQQQQPNNNILDSRGRSADSARKKSDYQRRLQTSASDADLSRYATSKRRSVPYSESKGLTLKQARRFIKERIFSSVAAREPRSTLPQASSVFSTAPPPPPPAATLTASPFTNGVTPVGTIAHHSEKTPVSSGTSSFFRKNKKKDKKPRIRKEDISNPTNFQHKAHVGWDQDSGFSNNVDSDPMDESIKNIIRAAGQDPNNLSKKTIKFVYDFIERYEENTTSDPNATAQFSRHQAPPPPVPISQWAAPPPPPPSRGASYAGSTAPPSRPPPPPPGGPGVRAIHARPLPQVPPSVQETRPHAVPPPPPPPSLPNIAPVVGGPSVPPAPPPPPPLSSTAPAAPPPPPSLSSSMPPPPPPSLSAVPPPQSSGRGDLLAQIQAGKQLRSVTTNAEKKAAAGSGADARGDVMAQIRLGANLKKVDHAAVEQEKRKSAPTLADMGGIAGALAKALEERRMNMCIDDSSDDDESDEKNEWSD